MKTSKPKPSGGTKVERIPAPPAMSKAMEEGVLRFIEYHPAPRFNRNLRKMLIEFLMSNGAIENFYLMDLLYDLEGFFELLDLIEAETLNAPGEAGP